MSIRQPTKLIVLFGLVTGCALFRGFSFERPTVSLDTIQVVALDLRGGRLNLLLDVYNPNGYDLRGTGLEATLELEETRFGDVQLERDFLLPAKEQTFIEIPMSFTWEGVGAGARALLTRGEVAYDLATLIRARTPGGDRPVRFHLNGMVRLADLGVGR